MRVFFRKISGVALMAGGIIRSAWRECKRTSWSSSARRWVYDRGDGEGVREHRAESEGKHEDPRCGGQPSGPVEPVGLRHVLKSHHRVSLRLSIDHRLPSIKCYSAARSLRSVCS